MSRSRKRGGCRPEEDQLDERAPPAASMKRRPRRPERRPEDDRQRRGAHPEKPLNSWLVGRVEAGEGERDKGGEFEHELQGLARGDGIAH
jgi:hypothetical protein